MQWYLNNNLFRPGQDLFLQKSACRGLASIPRRISISQVAFFSTNFYCSISGFDEDGFLLFRRFRTVDFASHLHPTVAAEQLCVLVSASNFSTIGFSCCMTLLKMDYRLFISQQGTDVNCANVLKVMQKIGITGHCT